MRRNALLALGLAFTLPLWAAELNVSAAASLTDAMKELATSYEASSGDTLVFNFGASSTLARQIQEGAPVDVFFSADEEKMDSLDKRGLLAGGSRRSLLSNSLVVVVAADSPLALGAMTELAEARFRAIALAEPQTVPAGIYAKQYLQKVGLWSRLADRVVPTENVRAALAAVESGNVEAGIVYKTDALISRKVRVAWEVPRAEGPEISYPVAALKASAQPEAARKFVAYLSSERCLGIFAKYGFVVHPAAS